MYRQTIQGLMKIRDLGDTGSPHVYTTLCRSLTRYMDIKVGMAMCDYIDVTAVVDTLPESPMENFYLDDNPISYGIWFDAVCFAVDVIISDNEYGFCRSDMEAIWRHFLSRQYWDSVYTDPLEDVAGFTMDHFLNPYIYRKGRDGLYGRSPDLMSVK